MSRIKIQVTYPLCRSFGREQYGGYSFESEIGPSTSVSAFLKVIGADNSEFQRMLSTPAVEPAGLVAVALNGRHLQFTPDLQIILHDNDRIELGLANLGC